MRKKPYVELMDVATTYFWNAFVTRDEDSAPPILKDLAERLEYGELPIAAMEKEAWQALRSLDDPEAPADKHLIAAVRRVIMMAQVVSCRKTVPNALYFGVVYGYAQASMLAASHSRGARKVAFRKLQLQQVRRAALKGFIARHGPVPPLREFGKPNRARSRYRQRFQRESGFETCVDTFNRDVKAVCANQR